MAGWPFWDPSTTPIEFEECTSCVACIYMAMTNLYGRPLQGLPQMGVCAVLLLAWSFPKLFCVLFYPAVALPMPHHLLLYSGLPIDSHSKPVVNYLFDA
jgi:hypothetical protein